MSTQTEEALSFRPVLRQLQEVTQTKAQLNLERLAKNYEDQQFRMVQWQEDQWTRMAEQMDTTFRKVLSQRSQADLVKLLPWFLSNADISSADPTCSVSEALTSITMWQFEGTASPASMSSPACRVSTPPPVLFVSDIQAAGTPVWQPFFALAPGLKHKMGLLPWQHTLRSKLQEGLCWHWGRQHQQWAQYSTHPPNSQPTAQSNQNLSFVHLSSSPVKVATDPDDRLAVEDLGSTIDHDRDSVVELSGGWCQPEWQQVRFKQWLTGKCCWLWSQVSNWKLPHMFRYWRGGHQLCPQKVPEESLDLLQHCQGLHLIRGPAETNWW